MSTRSLRRALAVPCALVLCVSVWEGCGEASLVGPAEAPSAVSEAANAAQKTSNQKFTFTGVTLSDETTTVEDGVIEAGSRDHKNDKNDFTNCSYFTEDYQESLGSFGSGDFASSDTDAVKTFCIDHFADRVQ